MSLSFGQSRIPTLDGWRALAILGVIAAHASMAFYNEAGYFTGSPFRFGVLGVDFFFGLSGLLITKLLLEEAHAYGSVSLTGFYIRRAFRILPPCLAFIAVCALLGLLRTRWELASSLLFFRNYLPDYLGSPYSAHLWSLAIEEHFYLVWPGLLVALGVNRGPATAACIALACALWRVADLHFHLFANVFPNAPAMARTDLRLDALLWGCVLAFALQHPAAREWLRKRYGFGSWLILAAAFVACVAWKPPLALMFTAMLIPLLLAGTVLHPAWLFSRFLDLAPLRWVGRISYSLYLWQQPFLAGTWEHALPLGKAQQWPWSLAASFICAIASYYILEKPLLRIGHKLAARVRQKQPHVTEHPAQLAEATSG